MFQALKCNFQGIAVANCLEGLISVDSRLPKMTKFLLKTNVLNCNLDFNQGTFHFQMDAM